MGVTSAGRREARSKDMGDVDPTSREEERQGGESKDRRREGSLKRQTTTARQTSTSSSHLMEGFFDVIVINGLVVTASDRSSVSLACSSATSDDPDIVWTASALLLQISRHRDQGRKDPHAGCFDHSVSRQANPRRARRHGHAWRGQIWHLPRPNDKFLISCLLSQIDAHVHLSQDIETERGGSGPFSADDFEVCTCDTVHGYM